jgi:hypothetical protein
MKLVLEIPGPMLVVPITLIITVGILLGLAII